MKEDEILYYLKENNRMLREIIEFINSLGNHLRMLLYYILIINGLNTLDYYVGIPLSDFNLLILYLLITGITLFTILYIHVKHHKKLTK